MRYLHSLLGAEVAERVLEVLLDPARQLAALVGAAEALVREHHDAVVCLASAQKPKFCYFAFTMLLDFTIEKNITT